PLSQITIVLSVILIFIFFITSADSATYVLGAMTTNGSLFPSLRVKLIWGILIAGTATVLLISGGGGLDALQTASLIAALPFSIIMLFMIASIFIMVKRDWQVRERKSKIKHDTQVKEDFRDEFLDDVKDEVYDEFSEEAYDDLKEKVYDEVYDEFSEQTYDDIKDEVYKEIIEESYDDIKEKVKDDIYDELKDEI